jgi:hypothetical protein
VLLTAVADVVAAVHHRDLVPGQGSQLFRQVRLVSLHGHQVVRVALLDKVGGVIALGVQRIHRHHRAAKVPVVDVGQQRGERRDLVGLRRDLPGRCGQPVVVTHRGDHVDLRAVRALRAAQALAVHRERRPAARPGRRVGEPPRSATLLRLRLLVRGRRVGTRVLGQRGQLREPGSSQRGGVDLCIRVAQRLLIRHLIHPAQLVERRPETGQDLAAGRAAPLRDRHDRVVARRAHRAHPEGQQRGQPVAPALPATRIGHRSQPRQQPRITRRIGRHQGVPTAQTCREQDRGLELQRWTGEHGTPMIMSLENSMISQRRARSSLQARQSQQPPTRSSTEHPGLC